MKKIFKSIACCCFSLAIAIACCFGAMKMSKNQRFLGTSCNKASASSSVGPTPGTIINGLGFLSNDLFIVNTPFLNSSSFTSDFTDYQDPDLYFYESSYSYFNTRVGFSLGTTSFQFHYSMVRSLTAPIYVYNTINYDMTDFQTITLNSLAPDKMQINFNNNSFVNLSVATPMQYVKVLNSTYYYNFGVQVYNSTLTEFVFPSLKFLDMYLTNSFELYGFLGIEPAFTNSNIIAYRDTNGFYFLVYLPNNANYDTNNKIFYFNSRRYIISDLDLTDNQYYQQGLSDGYNNGYSQGETQGYNNGYSQGKTEGYNNGYSQGLESSERLGFPALITSVIDVPVKVFTSLFNFDILGVNILTFVTSLLTIALILAIVRKVKSD